jgi:hypothetical protein
MAAVAFPDDYHATADLALGDVYWVEDWSLDPSYASAIAARAATTPISGPGAVLRALALGGLVCPGHVTVVPRLAPVPAATCSISGLSTQVRTGATITFTACRLEGGATLEGTVDVVATPQASDHACDANTLVTVSYQSVFTNFIYLAPDNVQTVIPSLVDTGSYQRRATTGPTDLAITTAGIIQRIDKSGAITSDHDVNGPRSYTFANAGSGIVYAVNGVLRVQDRDAGSAATVTGKGVILASMCCRPLGGSMTVAGAGRDPAIWGFGPACGAATLNGAAVSVPRCP